MEITDHDFSKGMAFLGVVLFAVAMPIFGYSIFKDWIQEKELNEATEYAAKQLCGLKKGDRVIRISADSFIEVMHVERVAFFPGGKCWRRSIAWVDLGGGYSPRKDDYLVSTRQIRDKVLIIIPREHMDKFARSAKESLGAWKPSE